MPEPCSTPTSSDPATSCWPTWSRPRSASTTWMLRSPRSSVWPSGPRPVGASGHWDCWLGPAPCSPPTTTAEALYLEAVKRLGSTGMVVEKARTQLALRRVAPAAETAFRCPRRAARRVRRVRDDRRRGVRPDGLATNCWPPESTPASALSTPRTTSHRKKRMSPGSPPPARPTPRSPRGCSSARAPSSTTFGRCSGSWRSRRDASSRPPSPTDWLTWS